MLSAVVVSSSSRRDGNTGALVDAIAQELAIEVVDLGDVGMSVFDYEHRNRGDEFEPLTARRIGMIWRIISPPSRAAIRTWSRWQS